jgi:hypothetical protein
MYNFIDSFGNVEELKPLKNDFILSPILKIPDDEHDLDKMIDYMFMIIQLSKKDRELFYNLTMKF